MQVLKAEFEARWREHVAGHAFWTGWLELDPEMAGAVRECLLAGGKRLRPLLFAGACRMLGVEGLEKLMPVALALELAHNFILIHDDLIDDSKTRRGRSSLPESLAGVLEGTEAGGFRGEDVALVAGDVLYSLALESLTRTEAPLELVLEATRAFMRAALDTSHGTLLEMKAARMPLGELELAEIERMYALKTGAYSFELPLRLAELFAGSGVALPSARFGRHAGVAFQLKNDREGLLAWLEDGPVPDDLRDRRPIWAVVQAWQRADGEGRRLLEEQPGVGLREYLRGNGVIAAMDAAIREQAGLALECLPGSSLREFVAESLAV